MVKETFPLTTLKGILRWPYHANTKVSVAQQTLESSPFKTIRVSLSVQPTKPMKRKLEEQEKPKEQQQRMLPSFGELVQNLSAPLEENELNSTKKFKLQPVTTCNNSEMSK
jgi:hypothetical protein